MTLASGKAVEAWTFNGTVPGPELTVRQGEYVEVTLRNLDVEEGVTAHWHGYRVPSGDDGVAGVSQDAVPPGGEFTYRFRAAEAGTFWYHSHEVSSEAVRKGLFGVFVVTPAAPATDGLDLAVPVHTVGGRLLFGAVDGLDRRAVPPGTRVRLRVVNTDSKPHLFVLRGTSYRLSAVDGRELTGPGELVSEQLSLSAAGRYDLTFAMPDTPVQLVADGRGDRGLLLAADPAAAPPPRSVPGPVLDITRYGAPAPPPLGPAPRFDREFTLVLNRQFTFRDGLPRLSYTVNGAVYPNIPALVVRQGELVKMTIANRDAESHPIHPHGHSMLVRSRNGVPATGSPLWMDTIDVGPGEVWEVALRADNPGVWMDHCHNLDHAAEGMSLHLNYDGITTPFTVGNASGNQPE